MYVFLEVHCEFFRRTETAS